MPLDPKPPITHLITSGETTLRTTPRSNEFSNILKLIEAAVAAELSFVQIREKQLSARVLFELVVRCAELTRGSQTKLLVNDRVDVALTAAADGVQLKSESMSAAVVRQLCQRDFLIGTSTHSLAEAKAARDGGADFVLFGPVFETESKKAFGPPQGVEKLRQVTKELGTFPVIAIGGVSVENGKECFRAGASGVAAIRLFSDARTLAQSVKGIREHYAHLNRRS
jgi:thiamine-phosphate pyrophosphorylase